MIGAQPCGRFFSSSGLDMLTSEILVNGMIMLGSARDDEFGGLIAQPGDIDGRETRTPYVVVEDLETHYARAIAAGAEIISELAEQPYGGSLYTCRDLEGHIWHFGTYDPWA